MLHSSYLTYIKLSTAIKRNKNMAKGLQKALLQPQPEDDSKRSARPQDLIRLYDIILQVPLRPGKQALGLCMSWAPSDFAFRSERVVTTSSC